MLSQISNNFPLHITKSTVSLSPLFQLIPKYGVLFLPGLTYGIIETVLHTQFPILALRNGFSILELSILLMSFSIGSLLFQIPLGILADKLGKRRVIVAIMAFASLLFISPLFIPPAFTFFLILFFLTGMFIGSLFSLGLGFIADYMPNESLTNGNVVYAAVYSVGCIIGPFLGAYSIELSSNGIFYLFSIVLLIVSITLFASKRT